MDKEAASQIMDEVLKLSNQLNVIAQKVEGLCFDTELAVMRRHIGIVMAALDENMFRPILKQYPELDPHR